MNILEFEEWCKNNGWKKEVLTKNFYPSIFIEYYVFNYDKWYIEYSYECEFINWNKSYFSCIDTTNNVRHLIGINELFTSNPEKIQNILFNKLNSFTTDC